MSEADDDDIECHSLRVEAAIALRNAVLARAVSRVPRETHAELTSGRRARFVWRMEPRAAEETPFDEALRRHGLGQSREIIRAALRERGLDDESARVLVNSLPGAPVPSDLPEANVSLTTNPLAPGLFSVTELGLTGDALVVGAYWLVFGLALLVVVCLVLFVPLPELFGEKGPSEAFLFFIDEVLPPAGFALVAFSLARGLFLVSRGRRWRIRRRR
ncbi:MAG: hypothetical protein MUC96_12070 [Myxococcaceae bacterium]|nr:hypothetical protein [Myxococcaceae bacterium]